MVQVCSHVDTQHQLALPTQLNSASEEPSPGSAVAFDLVFIAWYLPWLFAGQISNASPPPLLLPLKTENETSEHESNCCEPTQTIKLETAHAARKYRTGIPRSTNSLIATFIISDPST